MNHCWDKCTNKKQYVSNYFTSNVTGNITNVLIARDSRCKIFFVLIVWVGGWCVYWGDYTTSLYCFPYNSYCDTFRLGYLREYLRQCFGFLLHIHRIARDSQSDRLKIENDIQNAYIVFQFGYPVSEFGFRAMEHTHRLHI